MKALTLTQPWASLVAIGAKCIETRSWSTPYRGRLAIHAGKGLAPVGGMQGLVQTCSIQPFLRVLLAHGLTPRTLPLSVIVATVELVNVVPTNQLTQLSDQERAFGDYSPGRFGWILSDIQPLVKPVPARGALSLWNWEPPIEPVPVIDEEAWAWALEEAHA